MKNWTGNFENNNNTKTKKCPKCNATVHEGDIYCGQCKQILLQAKLPFILRAWSIIGLFIVTCIVTNGNILISWAVPFMLVISRCIYRITNKQSSEKRKTVNYIVLSMTVLLLGLTFATYKDIDNEFNSFNNVVVTDENTEEAYVPSSDSSDSNAAATASTITTESGNATDPIYSEQFGKSNNSVESKVYLLNSDPNMPVNIMQQSFKEFFTSWHDVTDYQKQSVMDTYNGAHVEFDGEVLSVNKDGTVSVACFAGSNTFPIGSILLTVDVSQESILNTLAEGDLIHGICRLDMYTIEEDFNSSKGFLNYALQGTCIKCYDGIIISSGDEPVSIPSDLCLLYNS